MFDKQYRFKGRHALRVDQLTGVFDELSNKDLSKKFFKKIKPAIIFFRHISENNNKNRWNIGEKRKILWQKKKEIFMKK